MEHHANEQRSRSDRALLNDDQLELDNENDGRTESQISEQPHSASRAWLVRDDPSCELDAGAQLGRLGDLAEASPCAPPHLPTGASEGGTAGGR